MLLLLVMWPSFFFETRHCMLFDVRRSEVVSISGPRQADTDATRLVLVIGMMFENASSRRALFF